MERLKIPKELKGKELTAYLVEQRDLLADTVIKDPEQLENFVRLWDGSLGMHEYSFNNLILAWLQYSKVSMMAGYKKWQSLGRTVIKGEKAIKVLAPLTRKIKDKSSDDEAYIITGWRYVNVFDVNQTDGEELDFGHSDKVTGADVSFDRIKHISPLPVIVEYAGTSNGNMTAERILVAPKDNPSAMIATLIHEVAHFKLNHIESDLDKEIKEIEAETVSFIVTTYLGLKNEKSTYYVGSWNGPGDQLKGRGKNIIAVAEAIIKDINTLLP
jgi:antirestriction protein ArdC